MDIHHVERGSWKRETQRQHLDDGRVGQGIRVGGILEEFSDEFCRAFEGDGLTRRGRLLSLFHCPRHL